MVVGLFGVALFLALAGLLLVVLSKRGRRKRGLGSGKTVALDEITLRSERLKLVGRPDRIVREGKYFIPEEWKSSKRVSHAHRLQVIAYCLLIEEEYGKRPPYGIVVLGNGSRVKVENSEALRSEVVSIAEHIRKRRRTIGEEIEVHQPLAKCRACGHRGNCEQASEYWQAEGLLRSVGTGKPH